mgnify:FL=1
MRGSVQRLEDAIRLHVDPLSGLSPEAMTGEQRLQFYDQLRAWASEPISGVYLDEDEIADLVACLQLLSFESQGTRAILSIYLTALQTPQPAKHLRAQSQSPQN